VILKLLSYNIRFGGVGRESLIGEVIRSVSPDIVVFQEAIVPRVIEELAATTGMPHWASRADHSTAFCSRIEIAHYQWHIPRGSRHAFLELVPAGTEARIFGLHLRAMFSKWGERRRAQEIQTLLSSIQKYQEGLHVLVGDFNALGPGEVLDTQKMPQWIRAMIWFSGRDIQRETVQVMLDRGYLDGFRNLHPDQKGYTFPTSDPHVRLDYIFIPAAFLNSLLKTQLIDGSPAARASDHFPLLSHLDF
jgi:exodeoxyribonuclease-3